MLQTLLKIRHIFLSMADDKKDTKEVGQQSLSNQHSEYNTF